MMKYLGIDYYVGWLSAAGVFGAAHQAPQVFQVAVSRQVRDRQVGRTRFTFSQRDVDAVPVVAHSTRAGSVRVATAAATTLDVASSLRLSGGLDNAATVIVELSDTGEFSIDEVVKLALLFPVAAGRRVGWVLENFGRREDLGPLLEVVRTSSPSPSRLDATASAAGPLDRRWMLYLNREVDPDL